MNALKIIAFVLIAAGAVINYGAKYIVRRLSLEERVYVGEADELGDKELEEYKRTKAISKVKLIGLFILLPGVILVFIAFR